MQIATDPLSLLFIIAFLLGLVFFVLLGLLGNLGHGFTHLGGSHAGGLHVHVHPGAAHGPTHAGHLPAHTTATAHGHGTPHGTNSARDVRVNRVVDNVGHPQQRLSHAQGHSLLSYLNPTSIFLFLFGFGLCGYLLHNFTRFVSLVTLTSAAIGGLVLTALILSLLGQLFGDSEGATIQDVSDRVGLLGKVSITIPENSLGEVIYRSPGGMRKAIPARSLRGDRIERDQEVVVVNYQKGVAEVDSWERFMNEGQTNIPGDSQKEELEQLRTLLENVDQNASAGNPAIIQQDIQQEH